MQIFFHRQRPKDVIEMRGSPDDDFRDIICMFDSLAQTENLGISLTTYLPTELPPNLIINLVSYEPKVSFFRRLTEGMRISRIADSSAMSFRWSGSIDDWKDVALLCRSLANAKEPGHQYLTDYPSDDALVVLSKGERCV